MCADGGNRPARTPKIQLLYPDVLVAGTLPAGLQAGASALFGVIAVVARFEQDNGEACVETWSARLLVLGLGVAFVTVAVPVLVAAVRDAHALEVTPTANADAAPKSSGAGLAAVVSLIAGVLLQVRARLADPATVLQQVSPAVRFLKKAGSGVRLAIVYFAGAVAGPLLLLMIFVVAVSVALAGSTPKDPDPDIGLAFLICGAAFALFYAGADITSWSLHPFYKRRLCTAFALKRMRRACAPTDERGYARERDFDTLVPLSESKVEAPRLANGCWPTLLVCAAANISDTAVTPPGRRVTSFTFSAEALGGPLVGGVATDDYEEHFDERRRRDFTLPAAVAMSGAALSPSMGKLTRRPLTFLMALANVRLGVWLPNPQRLGSKGLTRPRPFYLVRELLGLNSVTAKFLYDPDGGHYENLGLVELLRRGCTDIFCFDASGGTSFNALGDAIALARTELGVEVTIDPRDLVPEGERSLAKSDCATGTIAFPDGSEETLV